MMIVIVVIGGIISLANAACGPDEVNVTCPTLCPPTCANPNPRICPLGCPQFGCVCRPGFIRQGPGGPCIPECSCKGNCGAHEVNVTCPTVCPPTCQNPNPVCILPLCPTFGCVCEDGYIRQTARGPCIPKCECRGNCGPHEVNVTCPNPCEPTCTNPTIGICAAMCKAYGCVCENGYIRQFPGGPCVPKCGKVCGPFEEATQCDVPCQPTCQDPNRPPCPTLVCGSPDCVCKKGYIRKTDGSGCIPRGNCPAQCEVTDPNSMFYECQPCPTYCPGQPIVACAAICRPGCGCKKGFITNFLTRKCILPTQCPKT